VVGLRRRWLYHLSRQNPPAAANAVPSADGVTLNELKPRGYHLSDVPPDFR